MNLHADRPTAPPETDLLTLAGMLINAARTDARAAFSILKTGNITLLKYAAALITKVAGRYSN